MIPWATIALSAGFMASIGFVYANATALATTEVRYAAGTGSAVLGFFLQYGDGRGDAAAGRLAGENSAVPMGSVMFGAAALAATALFALTRGHVPSDSEDEPAPTRLDQPVTVSR